MSGGYYYQKDASASASLLPGSTGKRRFEYEEENNLTMYEKTFVVVRRNMFKICLSAAVVAALLAVISYNSNATPAIVSDNADVDGVSKHKFTTFTPAGSSKGTVTFGGASKRTTLSPTITVTSPGYGELSSLSLLPWDAVAEPYKEQVISISLADAVMGEKIAMADNDITATWTIAGTTYSGTTTTFQVDETGVFDCTVQIYYSSTSRKNKQFNHQKTTSSSRGEDTPSVEVQRYFGEDGTISYTFSFTLAVKYIRREIRTLSDSDREKVFDAMLTLYQTNQTYGEELYGSKYMSMETFMYYHLSGAGSSDCDHWHDGAGILTHHAAITLAFEQSLQSIDQTIALPYWEYAMDDILYENWYDSPIFYASWLGEANPSTSDHRITNSRFAGIEMPDGTSYTEDWSIADSGSLSPYSNPYGYMRTPWNMNKSPYFGRYNKTYNYESYTTFPGCSTLEVCYAHDSLADLFECSNGATHGPVHIIIGGSWYQDDDSTVSEAVKAKKLAKRKAKYTIPQSLVKKGFFKTKLGKKFKTDATTDYTFMTDSDKILIFKILWRTGYTRCPSTCDETTEDCSCSIPDSYFKTYGGKEIAKKASIYAYLSFELGDDIDNYSEQEWEWVLRAFENVDSAGEMFTSGAPYDPTFWPLHGTIERLVDYKLINVLLTNDTDFDTTWDYPAYNGVVAPHLDGICDWSAVTSSSDLTLPSCTFGVTCEGHNEDDEIEFSNFLDEDDTYTNGEFLAFIHPYNDYLTYVYDAYDFDYCEEDGVTFTAKKAAVALAKKNKPKSLKFKPSKKHGGKKSSKKSAAIKKAPSTKTTTKTIAKANTAPKTTTKNTVKTTPKTITKSTTKNTVVTKKTTGKH